MLKNFNRREFIGVGSAALTYATDNGVITLNGSAPNGTVSGLYGMGLYGGMYGGLYGMMGLYGTGLYGGLDSLLSTLTTTTTTPVATTPVTTT